ncbi:NAD-dependent epimerase/dehydratase family protein [Bradyrhizobium sp. DOA1]|uniref:NAD-dependent epimerase/dehydratase family protein n=1 Tax=Bradyrhizobium sp. DOA1 TaxID=1126616 RepID=UPI00077C5645|nr:NAD-dependent epimerase/dehydratase family protein [Bradyrhizobium sp. DOA1]KYG98574.1 epimerase [Bradyrhizobium sp. DOA1]
MDTPKSEQASCLVIGGSGLIGGYIVAHLVNRGQRVMAMSRSARTAANVQWVKADLRQPDSLKLPPFETLYCTTDAILLAEALPLLLYPSVKRAVVFSSTSVLTKQDTEVADERETIRKLTDAEQTIAAVCAKRSVNWTILRPTLIYAEGRDTNITPLSRLIRRFGFMPIVGGAPGLRQPVHAEDLAIGAIAAAASEAACNKFYALPGAETLSYREMVGRLFDGMRRPRRLVSVPPWLWRVIFAMAKPLFPTANVAMGLRMMKDMTFDATPAAEDFGWKPRSFRPVFD